MHGDLGGLCTFLRELDIRLTLLTTGLLLSKRATEVAEFFDDVIISLDGPPAVHDAIRRVKGSFALIESGMAAIRQLRPTMRIVARMTVQKANYQHLRDALLNAKEVGFDGISFLAADLTSEAFNRPVAWPADRQNEIALSSDEVCRLDEEIQQLIAHFADDIKSGYIAESPEKLRRIATHFKAFLRVSAHESPRCNAPWVSAVVEASGSVRPCFFHPALGNIHESSLEEIINGEAARAFRRELRVADDPVCQKCVCSLYRSGSES